MNLVCKESNLSSSNFPELEINNELLIKAFHNKNYEKSINFSKALLNTNKFNVLAFNVLALSYSAINQKDAAIRTFLEAINYNPNNNELYNNISNIYLEKKDYTNSIINANKAVKLNPNCSKSYFTLGVCYHALQEIEKAHSSFKKSFKLDKSNHEALLQVGNIYKDQKKFSKALEIYRLFQKLFPNLTSGFYNEGTIHLRNQRFRIGWEKYEIALKDNSRSIIDGYYSETKALWDGKPFDGTLLIYGEQGLGDQIFFGTALKDLLKIQKKIILKVNKKLLNFFSYNFKGLKTYSESDDVPKNSYEKYIAIGSICKFLRNDVSSFKNSTFKSFTVPKTKLNLRENFINQKPIIGISWYTTALKTGVNRSLTTSEISKIINFTGYNYVNLQYGNNNDQIRDIQQRTNNSLFTYPGLDLTNDFNRLSNLILECDLVLTIDNTTAHLSSSLGKKTWILLPYSADFRWLEGKTTSLWYPSAKLFRQSSNKKWDLTIMEVLKELQAIELKEY